MSHNYVVTAVLFKCTTIHTTGQGKKGWVVQGRMWTCFYLATRINRLHMHCFACHNYRGYLLLFTATPKPPLKRHFIMLQDENGKKHCIPCWLYFLVKLIPIQGHIFQLFWYDPSKRINNQLGRDMLLSTFHGRCYEHVTKWAHLIAWNE